jgi:DNA-binding CsgD family transcriptional regulator
MTRHEPVLTSREIEILALIVAGKTSKSIGAQLGISHRTVEVHRSMIKVKMGARSSTDLVRIAAPAEGGPLRSQQRYLPFRLCLSTFNQAALCGSVYR